LRYTSGVCTGNLALMASPDPRAPQHQLADLIRADIAAGRLAPGDPLPAVRRLAEMHGVAPNTAQQAIRALQRDGLIVTETGKGSHVADGAADKVPPSLDQLAQVMKDLTELTERVTEIEAELRLRSHGKSQSESD
jgi:DNA-binding transcriptional regulator YhcF (GntR family)